MFLRYIDPQAVHADEPFVHITGPLVYIARHPVHITVLHFYIDGHPAYIAEPLVHIARHPAYIAVLHLYMDGYRVYIAELSVYIDGLPASPGERRCYILSPQIYIDREGGIVFTSVDIDDELFMKAWGLSSAKTKKAFFEEAMRVYILLHEQAGVRTLRGKLVFDETPPATPRKRRASPR